MGYIYTITNIVNNNIYVGSTVNLKNRHRKHISHLKNKKHHNKKLQSDWIQYGASNFIFDIVEQDISATVVLYREQYWIDLFSKTHVLYNEVLDIGVKKSKPPKLPNLTISK